jgi:peroxiredoxin
MRLLVNVAATALCAAVLFAAEAPRRAPSFSLPDLNNQQHDLLDYRGRIVLVEIMRTTCPECRAFSKILEQVKTYYGDKVAVLSIAIAPDNPDTAKGLIAEHKLTYPILFDCGQVAYSYVRPNPLQPAIAVPHLYIVDPKGFIERDFVFGPATGEIFQGRGLYIVLDRMLGTKPAAKD